MNRNVYEDDCLDVPRLSLRALLIAAREAAGISQRLLARRCAEQRGGELEAWRRLISRYELPRGRARDGAPQEPTLATAAAVAEALGLRLRVALEENTQ